MGGDTCWRIFRGAFWLLERSFLSGGGSVSCGGGGVFSGEWRDIF